MMLNEKIISNLLEKNNIFDKFEILYEIEDLENIEILNELVIPIKCSSLDFKKDIQTITEKFEIKANIGLSYNNIDWRVFLLKRKEERFGNNLYNTDCDYYDSINFILQDNDIDFFKKIIEIYKCSNVLELAVGTNRIGNEILSCVNNFIGVDLSPDMIKQASLKTQSIKASFFCENMVYFNKYKKLFDFIYCAYNSIQMLNYSDIDMFFSSIKSLLSDNGIVIIDLFNPKQKYLKEEKIREFKCSFRSPYSHNDVIDLYETHKYNSKTKQNFITYEYINRTTNSIQVNNYCMTQFDFSEMQEFFSKSGFVIEKVYGNYLFNDFNSNSNKQIFILRKA